MSLLRMRSHEVVRFEFDAKEIPFLGPILHDESRSITSLIDVGLRESRQKFLEAKFYAERMGLQFYLDERLLFWEHHFEDKDWAVYVNRTRKGSTIRYKDGAIRIPASASLEVFETQEHEQHRPPRAVVTLDKVIITNELTKAELALDGFMGRNDMIEGMRTYYPNITENSVLSAYVFGKTVWR